MDWSKLLWFVSWCGCVPATSFRACLRVRVARLECSDQTWRTLIGSCF
ncbi:hypothetical protein SEVIR_2G363250v4 [Setaria viridis]